MRLGSTSHRRPRFVSLCMHVHAVLDTENVAGGGGQAESFQNVKGARVYTTYVLTLQKSGGGGGQELRYCIRCRLTSIPADLATRSSSV